MNRMLTLIATAGFLVAGTAFADAQQWSRGGTITGPYGGTTTTQGGGSCAGGSCSYGGSVTGPGGRSFNRSGNLTRTAPGQFQSSATYTGPRGLSASRTGSFSARR